MHNASSNDVRALSVGRFRVLGRFNAERAWGRIKHTHPLTVVVASRSLPISRLAVPRAAGWSPMGRRRQRCLICNSEHSIGLPVFDDDSGHDRVSGGSLFSTQPGSENLSPTLLLDWWCASRLATRNYKMRASWNLNANALSCHLLLDTRRLPSISQPRSITILF